MPRLSASRLRWVLLAAGLVCWLAGIFWIFNVCWPKWELFPGDIKPGAGLLGVGGFWWNEQWAYLLSAAGYFGVFLLTQWFFLGPRGSFRLQLNHVGRPLRLSVIIAALMAALLTIGLLALVAELCGIWQTVALADRPEHPRYWPVLLALALAWGLWAVVFFIYWRRGDRATQLSRMLRGLMGGSILELLIAAPVHVLILRANTKDKSCYCEAGSYTTLVLGSTVLLWTFGPGLILLFLREKARRQPLLSQQNPPSA
jgi:hypothetical protein